MSGEGKVVCVTGASGYVASWLVKHLLLRGYTVKATLRDPNDPKRTKHLTELDGAKDRLHLFKADLLQDGSFDSVVEGCDGVFHTASPVNFEPSNPQVEVVEPAVKGTLNVLKSCAKVPTLKRLILTSSIAAVVLTGKPLAPDVVADETWFSDPNVCVEKRRWYALSKTLAEEAAWKFAEENAIEMVVLNPTYAIGPLLQPTLNASVKMILEIIEGESYPNSYYPFIDVRDITDAHIQAFEISSANGRYCLATSMNHISEILKILHEHFPALKLPEKCEDGEFCLPNYIISREKAKTLCSNFIPLEVTLKDTVESLKEKGFIRI